MRQTLTGSTSLKYSRTELFAGSTGDKREVPLLVRLGASPECVVAVWLALVDRGAFAFAVPPPFHTLVLEFSGERGYACFKLCSMYDCVMGATAFRWGAGARNVRVKQW